MNHLALAVHLPMVDARRFLRRNIDNKCPTQRHIQDLMAAANGQQGLSLPEYLIDQQQLVGQPCLPQQQQFVLARAGQFALRSRQG